MEKIEHIYIDREKSSGRNTVFGKKVIHANKTLWKDLKKGDVVYIPGNIVERIPTAVYGRHTVVDPEKRILKNGKNKTFYENYEYVFVKV